MRFVFPEGFVRLRPGGVTWAAANDPNAQRCAVTMTQVEFDTNPARSFERGWRGLTFTQKNNMVPPTPVITRLSGGYTIGGGVWKGRQSNGLPFTFAVGNIARSEAGHMLLAYGSDIDCQAKFEALLRTVEIVDQQVASAQGTGSTTSAQTLANFYRDANRTEQQRANQRMQDQLTQDRLFQQQEQARQAQNRMMQQQIQAQQAQQRIQDSYRR